MTQLTLNAQCPHCSAVQKLTRLVTADILVEDKILMCGACNQALAVRSELQFRVATFKIVSDTPAPRVPQKKETKASKKQENNAYDHC